MYSAALKGIRRQLLSCLYWWKTCQSPLSSEAPVNGQEHCLLRQKELVKEQGAEFCLNGNCDRMDMKVLGLANHSKISNDYLN